LTATARLQTTAPASAERRRTSHGTAAKDDQRWRRRRKYKNVGVRGGEARREVGDGQRVAGRRAADAGAYVTLATAADAVQRRRRNEHLLNVQETAFTGRVTSRQPQSLLRQPPSAVCSITRIATGRFGSLSALRWGQGLCPTRRPQGSSACLILARYFLC